MNLMRRSYHLHSLIPVAVFFIFTWGAYAGDYREQFLKGKKPGTDSEFIGKWASKRFDYEFRLDGELVIREAGKIVERATWVTSTDPGVIYVDFDPKRWSTEFNRLTMHRGQVIIPLGDTWAHLTRVPESNGRQDQATDKQAEQGVAPQSATRSESDPESGDKPQPESEPRPR